jgi:hypothetical protein
VFEDVGSAARGSALPEPPFEPEPAYPDGLLERDWQVLAAGAELRSAPSGADVADAVAGALPAGAGLAALLEADSTRPGGAGEVLDRIRGWAQMVARAQGMLAGEIAALYASREDMPAFLTDPAAVEPLREFVAAEIAAALHLAPTTAQDLLDDAVDLVERVPAVHAALTAGRIDYRTARVLAEETVPVSHEHLAAVVAGALGRAAAGGTAAQVRAFTRRAALRLDPVTATRREAAAVAGRRVERGRAFDGVAEITALLPIADADALWATVDAAARALPATLADGSADQRSLDDKRADVLVALITRPDTVPPPPVRYADVVIPISALTGTAPGDPAPEAAGGGGGSGAIDDGGEPAEVAGWGPVTTATALPMVEASCWRAVVVDAADRVLVRSHPEPRGGDPAGRVAGLLRAARAALAGDPERLETPAYRPSRALVDHVEAVHRRCRFPGCRRRARACDKDHVLPWLAGGLTCACNLIPLCRRHHRAKHAPGWRVRLNRDRSVTWTTPTGHRWTDPPPTVWD